MSRPSSPIRGFFLPAALAVACVAGFAAPDAAAQQPVRRATVPERSGPAASRGLEVAAGPGFFVVTDNATRRLAVYAVEGGTVRLIGTRDVDADLGGRTPEPGAPVRPPAPAADAAGQDPPGFPRPERSVRVQSAFVADRRPGDGKWDARYVIPGDVATVYGSLRASLTGWSVERESVGTSPASATLVVARPSERLEIVVGDRFAPEGWSTIDVTLSRRAD